MHDWEASMKLHDVKIGKRLAGGFAIFIAIITLLCVISFMNMRNTDMKLDEMVKYNFEKATLANTVLVSLQVLTRETANAVYTKSTAPFEIVGAMRKQYSTAMEKLEKMETDEKGKTLIAKIKENIAGGKEGNVKLAQAAQAGNFNEAVNLYNTVVNPAANKVIEDIGEMVKYQEEGVRLKHRQIIQGNRQVRTLLIICSIFALILCAFVSFIITRSIATPIQKNIEAAKTLAEGNLTVHIDVDRRDEFGDEMTAFKA